MTHVKAAPPVAGLSRSSTASAVAHGADKPWAEAAIVRSWAIRYVNTVTLRGRSFQKGAVGVKCLILAAGDGGRMAQICDSKPLVPVAGLPLIERSIATAQQAGITEFYVVTGYKAERVEAFLRMFAKAGVRRIPDDAELQVHAFLEETQVASEDEVALAIGVQSWAGCVRLGRQAVFVREGNAGNANKRRRRLGHTPILGGTGRWAQPEQRMSLGQVEASDVVGADAVGASVEEER